LTQANDTWPVGILFSRSGIVKITESEHFRGTALAIEEINTAGGVLGREIAPVCYDPMSNVSEYRRLADKLLTEDGVSIIFGCMTSVCRKAILAALERRNGLLWYPANYEGFEYSPNIIYTGAAPNQHTLQLGRFLIEKYGNDIALVGTDYIFPRETNRVLRYLVENTGRLVTHDDLLTAVWRDVHVQPEVLKTHILAIRTALGDDSGNPTFIETQRGRGYRFIGQMAGLTPEAKSEAPLDLGVFAGRVEPMRELLAA